MKTVFLSAFLLLGICTLATAQHKFQFGVSIQSGNYLQAHQELRTNALLSNQLRLKTGVTVGLGLSAERRLGSQFALSSGLTFFQSLFTEYQTNTYTNVAYRPSFGLDICKQTQHFTVRQLALPVQFIWRPGAGHRLDFSFGAAPSIAMTKVQVNPENPSFYSSLAYIDIGIFIDPGYIYYSYSNEPDLKLQMLYTLGLHFRPDTRNTIGLEFWLASKVKDTDQYQYYEYGTVNDSPARRHRMQSLQVSLRHNWQR